MAEEELRKRSAEFDGRDAALVSGLEPRGEALRAVQALD